jgi:hypothetical protein
MSRYLDSLWNCLPNSRATCSRDGSYKAINLFSYSAKVNFHTQRIWYRNLALGLLAFHWIPLYLYLIIIIFYIIISDMGCIWIWISLRQRIKLVYLILNLSDSKSIDSWKLLCRLKRGLLMGISETNGFRTCQALI